MPREDDDGAGNAGGKGDPIMTGFGGRSFEFIGQPGNTYSLISEKVHKVLHLARCLPASYSCNTG